MEQSHVSTQAVSLNQQPNMQPEPKPLLRGWLHAGAFLTTTLFTIILVIRTTADPARMVSLLIFGLSTMELYGVSALFHIGRWSPRTQRTLRALDHANIFVLIAGTYTPICFNVLSGGLRVGMLITIWLLALGGITNAIFTAKQPRWLAPVLYVSMGWVAIVAAPAFLALLPRVVSGLMVLGGIFYT